MLEDEYSDIVKKASKGLGKKVNSSDGFAEVARELNLNLEALRNIKEGNYEPKEFDFDKSYDGLRVKKISSLFMGGEVNAYVVINGKKNCIIIDTAQVPEKIIEFVKKEKLYPSCILKTHEHQDHIEGAEEIGEEFGVDVSNFNDLEDSISFGEREVKVFRTPGHSKESLTFQIGKFLFVGDLIFAGSFGGGMYSYEKLLESANKILNLDENLFIFPGHGPVTTVKEERENNAFFN